MKGMSRIARVPSPLAFIIVLSLLLVATVACGGESPTAVPVISAELTTTVAPIPVQPPTSVTQGVTSNQSERDPLAEQPVTIQPSTDVTQGVTGSDSQTDEELPATPSIPDDPVEKDEPTASVTPAIEDNSRAGDRKTSTAPVVVIRSVTPVPAQEPTDDPPDTSESVVPIYDPVNIPNASRFSERFLFKRIVNGDMFLFFVSADPHETHEDSSHRAHNFLFEFAVYPADKFLSALSSEEQETQWRPTSENLPFLIWVTRLEGGLQAYFYSRDATEDWTFVMETAAPDEMVPEFLHRVLLEEYSEFAKSFFEWFVTDQGGSVRDLEELIALRAEIYYMPDSLP